MGSLIQQHRGRVVGTPGDSVLAEFGSVVDAVQCAVEIQQVLRAKNAMLPENRRMEFRIGINLGDVIEEGDTIYGDGVNIAARLEGLAEAGGICISESAYQQIENKLHLRYDYLGEHEVKNIAKPVRVYCARIEADAGPSKLGVEKKPAQRRLSWC
jgi:class 3 adenylate cyclase